MTDIYLIILKIARKVRDIKLNKRITSQLDECLELHNAEIYDYNDKIIDVDIKNKQ